MVYTHRNGEVEEPTVPGEYWFKGQLLFIDGSDAQRQAALVISVREDRPLDQFKGQWWGPIQTPWES